MRKVILLILVFCLSCSSSSDDSPPNNPPSSPFLFYPTNNLFCIDSTIEFEFTSVSDPDGDTVTYDIEFSTDTNFTVDLTIFSTINTVNTYTLENGQTYFWRVRAKDSRGLYSEYSETFTFYTQSEGQINSLPFSPSLIQPINESTVSSININLEWNAIDIDGDSLVYDIYIGTENPPVNIAVDNLTNTAYTFQGESSSTYYWRVVAKDGNGGETLGQIWSFNTN